MRSVCRAFWMVVAMLLAGSPDAWGQGEPRFKPVEAGKRVFRGAAGAELSYLWLTPREPKAGQRYPLVVCLHGSGGNSWAAGFLEQPAMRKDYPCFVMTPQLAKTESWANTAVLERGLKRSEKLPLVVEAIKQLIKDHPIDRDRIYVTGQSLGGVGAWGAAARYPDLFAASVPVAGAWRLEDAKTLVSTPVWAFHGEKDPTVPAKWSRELCAAIAKAGGTAKYTEYPGMGHGSWAKAYADAELWQWLFQQRRKTEAAPGKSVR